MRSTKNAMRDGRNITSDHTGRGGKNNTHQSSSVPRILLLDKPRSSYLICHPSDLEPASEKFGRLCRLKTLQLELKEVEKSLSFLFMHNPSSLCRVPFFGRHWFCYLDGHRHNVDFISSVFGLEVFDHLRRLRLELQEVERTLSVLDMDYICPAPRILFKDSHLDCHPHDLTFLYDVFGRDLLGLDNFVRFELQDIERNLPVFYKFCRRPFKRSKPQLLPIQIIDWPWTDFPILRKQAPQVSPDAYRPFFFQYSGRERKDHIVRQITTFDNLQAQREPLDNFAIENSIDVNRISLKKVSKWRLWEGRSKEWRRCKVLKMLSSTPVDTLAVRGKRLESLKWEKRGTTAPIAMLQRNPRVRRVHAPKKEAAKQWRSKDAHKDSWRARVIEIEDEA